MTRGTCEPGYQGAGLLTCVAPASDVTAGGGPGCLLPVPGQAGRQHMATEGHTAAPSPRQPHQGQVVVVAMDRVARVGDDLLHGVFRLVLLWHQDVVVAHSDFVRLCAVPIPVWEEAGCEPRLGCGSHDTMTLKSPVPISASRPPQENGSVLFLQHSLFVHESFVCVLTK